MKVLISRTLEENGFANGFSTRLGGVSSFPKNDLNLAGFGEDSDGNIAENRRRYLDVFAEDFELATVWQVHSDRIAKITDRKDASNLEGEKCDAIISDLSNLLLGVKTADCVPILIGDAKTRCFAAVHAGWRGTSCSIVRNTVERMAVGFGSKTDDLICVIGPAASAHNYEIGQDVIDAFRSNFDFATDLLKPSRNGHALIDLPLANRLQLIRAGVRKTNISTAPFCTIERTDLFFSYRIEKNKFGKTGRLMSVIGKFGE